MSGFSHSAILYLNDDFDGGELFFTNRDAKTITVSRLPILIPGSVRSPFPEALPSCSVSPGSSEAQLRSPGGLLLGSGKSTWCYRGDQRPSVRAGPLVHKGEDVQGHGERDDDLILRSDLSPAVT